jgi:hypothetical protein
VTEACAGRIVCWFSCGAASAVATKLTIASNKARAEPTPLVVVRCRLDEEHPDNDRFASECEDWFGVPIITLPGSPKYGTSIYAVFEGERYINGAYGAPCTRLLKRKVGAGFRKPGDIDVYGYSAEEQERADNLIDANNTIVLRTPLIDAGLTHSDCLAMVERAGIDLPVMYRMGYKHNNCIGCVKAGAGYWNRIRVDFPKTFRRMAKLERKLGASVLRIDGAKVFLDELPKNAGRQEDEPTPQCGIFCELAEQTLAES